MIEQVFAGANSALRFSVFPVFFDLVGVAQDVQIVSRVHSLSGIRYLDFFRFQSLKHAFKVRLHTFKGAVPRPLRRPRLLPTGRCVFVFLATITQPPLHKTNFFFLEDGYP